MGRRKVTDEQLAEMRRLKFEGRTLREIASHTKLGVSTIQRATLHMVPTRKLSDLDRARICRLFQSGVMVKEIAAQFGVNRHSIQAVTKKMRPADSKGRYPIPSETVARMKALYRGGAGLATIERECCVSMRTVERYLKHERAERRRAWAEKHMKRAA